MAVNIVQQHIARDMPPVLLPVKSRGRMNPEDDEAAKPPSLLVPPVLDRLGVAELTAYIGLLEAEIARVRTAIAAKDAHRTAAAALFRLQPPDDASA